MNIKLLEIGEMPKDFRQDKVLRTISEELGVQHGLREYHGDSSLLKVDARDHDIAIDGYLKSDSIKGLLLILEFDECVTDCWSVDGHSNELARRDMPGGCLQAMMSSWYEDSYSANHPFARSEYDLTMTFIALEFKSGWVGVYSSELEHQFGRIFVSKGQDKTRLEFYLEKELSSRDIPYKFPKWNIKRANSLESLMSEFERETIANFPEQPSDSYKQFDRAIFLHGESSYGAPLLTFARMQEILQEMQGLCNPSTTLVYIAGWEGPYDMARPKFSPSEACGGEDAFASLCKTAHSFGYRVMPHINITGINPWSEDWLEFKDCITRNHNNEERWWRFDVDGDGREEAYLAYVNPGYQKWSDYFCANVKALVERYELQAVYVDQTSLAWNDPNASHSGGKVSLLRRLIAENPGLMLGGEGIVQSMLPYTPFIQMCLSSAKDKHLGRKTLFDSYIRKVPFLTLPAADGSEIVYPPRCSASRETIERAYSELIGFDYVPTVAFGRGGWNSAAEEHAKKVFGA